jgi:hypothetical protein
MEIILTISDAFKSENGKTVIAGINPVFDSLSIEQIKKVCIGKKLIKNEEGYIKIIEIEDVQFTESMWGKKNIFLLLSTILPISEMPDNAKIYTTNELM